MTLGLEAFHLGIEYADAIGITFFRVLAEQLLSDTDSEDGLLQVADEQVEFACSQIVHSLSGVTLSWEQHSIGLLQ